MSYIFLILSKHPDGFPATGTVVQSSSSIPQRLNHPKVVNFQPYYVFDARFMEDLKLGAMILKEHLELVSEKQTREEIAKKNEKATKEEELMKVSFYHSRHFSLIARVI